MTHAPNPTLLGLKACRRQVELFEFEASLVDKASSTPARATRRNTDLKDHKEGERGV